MMKLVCWGCWEISAGWNRAEDGSAASVEPWRLRLICPKGLLRSSACWGGGEHSRTKTVSSLMPVTSTQKDRHTEITMLSLIPFWVSPASFSRGVGLRLLSCDILNYYELNSCFKPNSRASLSVIYIPSIWLLLILVLGRWEQMAQFLSIEKGGINQCIKKKDQKSFQFLLSSCS
jgi:hypothetical protein